MEFYVDFVFKFHLSSNSKWKGKTEIEQNSMERGWLKGMLALFLKKETFSLIPRKNNHLFRSPEKCEFWIPTVTKPKPDS